MTTTDPTPTSSRPTLPFGVAHRRVSANTARYFAKLSVMGTDYVTTTEAAAILGILDTRIRLVIRNGSLPATRNELGHWRIALADLEAYNARRTPSPHAGRRRTASTTAAWRTLAALAQLETASADELAAQLSRHPGNVRKHLAALRQGGYVTTADDRAWKLTDKGRHKAATSGLGSSRRIA